MSLISLFKALWITQRESERVRSRVTATIIRTVVRVD